MLAQRIKIQYVSNISEVKTSADWVSAPVKWRLKTLRTLILSFTRGLDKVEELGFRMHSIFMRAARRVGEQALGWNRTKGCCTEIKESSFWLCPELGMSTYSFLFAGACCRRCFFTSDSLSFSSTATSSFWALASTSPTSTPPSWWNST